MKLFKNLPVAAKLMIMILPSIIALAACILIFVNRFNTMLADTERTLFDELYQTTRLLTIADRNFYQAALAEKEVMLSFRQLEKADLDELLVVFKDNSTLTTTRVTEAVDYLRENPAAFTEQIVSGGTENLETLEKSFQSAYTLWRNSYNLAFNSGDKKLRAAYFEDVIYYINQMTTLIEEYGKSSIEALHTRADSILQQIILMAGVITLGVLLISLLVIIYMRRSLSYVTKVCDDIADGYFGMNINKKYLSRDEIGRVCASTENILIRLNTYVDYIQEIAQVLDTMAGGNMNIVLERKYEGEFEPIKNALINISRSLGETLFVISESAQEVNHSAAQVSDAAHALADGASEQTGAVGNLSGSINNVSAQVNQTAVNAKKAKTLSVESEREVTEGNAHMHDMLEAMQDISSSSYEISKIMKVIDDIAFQTNILALNASVEAARAGTAGKGFSVVANEVRSLANKSAVASAETTTLVQNSIKSVEDGQRIANLTATSLKVINEKTIATRKLIDRISSASEDQTAALKEIVRFIDEIGRVVSANADTAELSSAASRQLSLQSETLNSEVLKFNL